MNTLEDFKNQVAETKPEILQEISGVLKILYPNISVNVINNIMIEKIGSNDYNEVDWVGKFK